MSENTAVQRDVESQDPASLPHVTSPCILGADHEDYTTSFNGAGQTATKNSGGVRPLAESRHPDKGTGLLER